MSDRVSERTRPAEPPPARARSGRLRSTLAAGAFWLDRELRRRRPHPAPEARRRDVLLMAWAFPPHARGGVYRPTALARHLPELGWTPSVAAGPTPAVASRAGRHLLGQVGPSISVHRFRRPRVAPFRRLLPSLDGGGATMVEWMDQLRRWIDPGKPPAIIMATGPPFNGFVAARYLARAFGSKLVLDYRDEWTECPFSFVEAGALDRWYERRCLSAADAVVFTTRAALDHQRSVFGPSSQSDWRVIPNGWEPSEHDGPEPAVGPVRDPVVRLCFAGHLGGHTQPGAFLQAVEAVVGRSPDWRQRLRLRFVGSTDEVSRSQLAAFAFPEMIERIEQRPRIEAHGLMRRASALVLFNSPLFARYLPGKLYDYLACRRPIVVFGRSPGETPRLIERLHAGYVIGGSSELEAVLGELDSADHGRLEDDPVVGQWLAEHTRHRMTERFADLFDELVG